MVTAHYGNFEVGGFMLGLLGFPTFTVARNLDNPYLDRFVSRFRGATGQFIIPKNGGYDQNPGCAGSGGYDVDPLPTSTPAPKETAAVFRTTGLRLQGDRAVFYGNTMCRLPSACAASGTPAGIRMECLAVADPRDAAQNVASIHEMTQWYTSKLEEMIRRAPEQYWWLHRRWKDTRPPRRERILRRVSGNSLPHMVPVPPVPNTFHFG